MGWLLAAEVKRDPIAAAEELRGVFGKEHDYLYWIAYVITGDHALANKCLVDACGLSSQGGGVFRDWLWTWSGSATARVAVDCMRESIGAALPPYLNLPCDQENDEVLSGRQIKSICQLDPDEVISDLDPISRAMLVLRGFQGASIADCALHMQIPRKCAMEAYCNAMRWASERTPVDVSYGNLADSLWKLLDAED